MTKEELRKEAIQYAVDYPTSYGKGYKHIDLRIAYLAGAEPREKQIAELEVENKRLAKHILELQADKGKLTDEVKNAMNNNIKWGAELADAKAIIRELLSDIPNRMWYTDKTIQKAEAFINKE